MVVIRAADDDPVIDRPPKGSLRGADWLLRSRGAWG
jgi:hypothetical protein